MFRWIKLIFFFTCIGLIVWKVKSLVDLRSLSFGSASAETIEGSPDYITDFEEAKKISTETGKPMLLIFTADWCGYCKKNERQLYPSKEIQPYHDQFIWTKLDTDQPKNEPLARRYQVRGLPTMIAVSSEGKLLGSTGGYQPSQQFAAFLSQRLGR